MTRDRGASRRKPGQRGSSARFLRDTLTAYAYLSPSALLIGVFGIFPLFFTVYVSLFKWRLARGDFAGLANYVRLLGGNLGYLAAMLASLGGIVLAVILFRRRGTGRALWRAMGVVVLAGAGLGLGLSLPSLASLGDKDVFDSLRVTIWYSFCTVPIQLAAGLVMALLLTRRMRGRQAFRVIFLIPYIAPTVATAAIFELLFSLRPDSFANQLIRLLGAGPFQWLQESRGITELVFGAAPQWAGVVPSYWASWAQGPSLALVSVIIFSWWVFVGYYALIFINGLGAIPRQLYEAAEVDGAGKVRSFFSITIPLLSPTTYFLSLLGVIGTFKAFTQLYVLRSAAASGTVDAVSVFIFFTAFRKSNMGYASAISILLFLIVLGLTVLQQRTSEKGVQYGD